MTREEFASRFHIPLDTVVDWEEGRSEPDQIAQTYLRVIANDAKSVQHALQPKVVAV
jgi:putative transcriptional regulator